eukprot:TRINITY_DN3056_c0_g1_i1.p1 TRINITY_DN3056_c0_g1~~TRINITY_DN3056_c0_g1_i1.p1  ORF type:complete len:1069 (+),score=306.19 TRINITY_DN3056_c0_g1_i1:30-3209(+)
MKCCGTKQVESNRCIYSNNVETANSYPKNVVKNTKYTWYGFVPKFLFEQFSRLMNIYFLTVACLQLLPQLTPVDPITTWAPLIMTLGFAGLKDGYDDYKRSQSDKEANSKPVFKSDGKNFTKVFSSELSVGSVIKLHKEEEIPADCVVLKTSDIDGRCNVMTANLDGETDLKPRKAADLTKDIDELLVAEIDIEINCEAPNANIRHFEGNLVHNGKKCSLNADNVLLQGVRLKTVDYVFAIVVFTGNDTKFARNKETPATKWTAADKKINRLTSYLWAAQLFSVIVLGTIGNLLSDNTKMWYLRNDIVTQVWILPNWLVVPIRFFLLCTLMIPISMKVTLDFCKALMGWLINNDKELYEKNRDIAAKARSSQLADDLGCAKYIFSDKTGTLTENIMNFKHGFCGSQTFTHQTKFSNLLPLSNVIDFSDENQLISAYLHCLVLNNTCIIAGNSYESNSPDEVALAEYARKAGVKLLDRNDKIVQTSIGNSQTYEFEELALLKFNSDRKRMSILIRDSQDNYFVLIKGADETVLPLLRHDQALAIKDTNKKLEFFAQQGLRTLVIAARRISKEEAENFLRNLSDAENIVGNRQQHVNTVYSTLEKEFILLGLTAIEDKLQQDVPQVVDYFRKAGIRFWMLTGDKQSTAIQIGISCRLYNPSSDILVDIGASAPPSNQPQFAQNIKEIIQKIKTIQEKNQSYVVVIDSRTFGLAHNVTPKDLFTIFDGAAAVIGCRLAPKQKAQAVTLVRNASDDVCLAIGDGGNDVNMIQTAHVGLGIVGREGLQASRAADYSIGAFRHLKRLVAVHGRQSYRRTAVISQYCFFKSLAIAFPQLAYAFYTQFSGTSFFNTFSLTAINMFFTALQPVAYTFDIDIDNDLVLNEPKLLGDSTNRELLTGKTFLFWVLNAMFQGLLPFFIGIYLFDESPIGMKTLGYADLPMIVYSSIVLTQTLCVLLLCHNLNIVMHIAVWASFAFYFICILVGQMKLSSLANTGVICLGNLQVWLFYIVCMFISTLPLYIKRIFAKHLNPNVFDINLDKTATKDYSLLDMTNAASPVSAEPQ